MEKISAADLIAAILSEISAASSFPLGGIILLCKLVHSGLYSCAQTALHFLFSTGERKNTNNITTPSDSEPCSEEHVNSLEDDDGGEKLTRGEVEVVMERLGIFCDPNGEKIPEGLGSDDISALFEAEEVTSEEVREAFDVFDENSDGFIDANELGKVLYKLGLTQVKEMQCQRMIAAFDDNGDGFIDFDEFAKLLESNCGH